MNFFDTYKDENLSKEDKFDLAKQALNISYKWIKEAIDRETKYDQLTAENAGLKTALEKAQNAENENAVQVQQMQAKLQELGKENVELKEKVESAGTFIERAEREAEEAEPKARNKIAGNLQTVRDRIYIIGETIAVAGQKQTSKGIMFSLDELNNVILSLSIIVDEMKQQNLWVEDSPIPILEKFAEKKEGKKTSARKSKSKTEGKTDESDSSKSEITETKNEPSKANAVIEEHMDRIIPDEVETVDEIETEHIEENNGKMRRI